MMVQTRWMFRVFWAVVWCFSAAVYAQRGSRPYVVLKTPQGPKRIECRSITASPDGRLTVMTESARNQYARANYVVAVIPRPEAVESLSELMDDEKYNELVRTAGGVFESYKFLGYADEVARLYCEALMALERYSEADAFYRKALTYPRADEFNLLSVRLMLMVHERKTSEAEKLLQTLMEREDDALAAFVFLMRGRISEAQGQKKEAVLQYLKTFLSFEDRRKVRRFRRASKSAALRLMKELNDPLAASLEKMK